MSIVLEHLTKRYGRHPVVNDVSLEIVDGEFFVLLGSSGSGKTTVLNMVAGLTAVDHGRIFLHGRDVTDVPTQDRRVGFVFQDYALFQHMTVADNIEFGLGIRKVPAPERRRRRDELLELVGLVGLGRRMPRQLSGGQQQRVALARALAIRPDVLLLDEPLGALDAKIRIELRRTLRGIQRELDITTILVTHDQEEAFELADRLGVMSFGRLLEVGSPPDLYQHPQTEFVASFLGTANLLVGAAATGGAVSLGPVRIPLTTHQSPGSGWRPAGARVVADPVQVLFRPEEVVLAVSEADLGVPALGLGEVEHTVFVGSYQRLRLRLPPLPGVRPIAPPVAFGERAILVEAVRSQDEADALPLAPGDRAWVGIRHIHALTHPGLHFLILTDGSPEAQAAIVVGGTLARLAHARATILGYGIADAHLEQHLQAAKELMGSGLASLDARASTEDPATAVAHETDRQRYDLVVLGHAAPGGLDLAESVLSLGGHNLLLVPTAQDVPSRALVCVATGEPGKDDVLFAGRLLRHAGASTTVMSVLPAEVAGPGPRERTDRFLAGAVRTLDALGVPAATAVRTGPVVDCIVQAMQEGDQDLLVLGAPLPDMDGRIALKGVVADVLARQPRVATLIVRSNLPPHGDMVAGTA
jgi:sulfate/thiosulfate transport system ATP-binding protein